MTAANKFELKILLSHLNQLNAEVIEQIGFSEAEWMLTSFITSWGQQFPVDPASWPPAAQQAHLRRFGATYLPFSIASDFPAVPSRQISIMALAMTYLNIYIMLVDQLIDEPLASPAAVKLALQPPLFHFHRLLSQLFPAESPFWAEVELRLNLTAQTMLDEHQLYSGSVHPFTLGEFKRIACGKMAFASIHCLGLASLNGVPEHIPTLTECWNAIALAAVVRDDVLDWRKDYQSANYTYLLSQVLLSPLFRAEVEAGHLPEPAEVGAALFCTDLIESLYLLAAEELKIAGERATAIDCPALANLINEAERRFSAHPTKLLQRRIGALLAMQQ